MISRRRAGLIPEDVLAVCGKYLQMHDVKRASLVCRSWARVFLSDVIWKDIAKRVFIQLPMLRLTPCRRDMPANDSSVRSSLIIHKQELLSHKLDLLTQKEVQHHHPYILHGLLALAWITAITFLIMLLMITEGRTGLTFNDAFQMLQTSYAVMFTSLLFNVIASTHWEPQPLVIRIQRHSHLISMFYYSIIVSCIISIHQIKKNKTKQTTALSGVSLFVVIVFFFITKLFQYNVTSSPEDRYPWVVCFTPILLMLGFWQMVAV